MPVVGLSPWKEALGRTAHFLEYTGLTIWLVYGMTAGEVSKADLNLKTAALLVGAAFLYALSDEVHKVCIPGRTI